MIEEKDLGVKIAENTDEAYWTEVKEKAEEALKTEERNKKINQTILNLAIQQLKKKN